MSSRVGRFVARYLDRETISKIAPGNWIYWRTTADYYRGIGYRYGMLPPQTGDMFVQTPYADWYNLVWGLEPNQDMPKWRWMYRARPEIRQGIDKKTILAVGRGFQTVVPDDQEIEAYVNRLMDILNIRDVTQAAVSDMLIYGQAYFEKIRVVGGDEQEHEQLELAPIERRVEGADSEVTGTWNSTDLDFDESDPKKSAEKLTSWKADVDKVEAWVEENREKVMFSFKAQRQRHTRWMAKVNKALFQAQMAVRKKRMNAQVYMDRGAIPEGAPRAGQGLTSRGTDMELRQTMFEPEEGELVELKALDPLWMRVTRDAFGNVLGFLQWGLTPVPQSVIPEKLVYLRWLPKSWAHENAYGTSVLMPVQRHVSMLIQAEEDMKVFWHQYAKPMLAIYGGTQDKPYPVPMLQSLQSKMSGRQPNTDAVVPGDVKIEVIKGGTGDTETTFKTWSKYLREKIYETLGIPSILMNLPDLTTRATSDVSLQAFIAEERMIQEMVGEQLLKQVIEPEVRRHFAYKYPGGEIPAIKVVWPSVLEEDRNKKADRIVKLTGRPAISVNEARTELGFPPLDDPEYDEIAEAAAPGFGQASKPEESASKATGPREELKEKQQLETESSEDVIAG